MFLLFHGQCFGPLSAPEGLSKQLRSELMSFMEAGFSMVFGSVW